MPDNRMYTAPEGKFGHFLAVYDDECERTTCMWAWDSWGERAWINIQDGEPVVHPGMGPAPGGWFEWLPIRPLL